MSDRRTRVQADYPPPGIRDHHWRRSGIPGSVAGTVTWEEHAEAWEDYAARYGGEQDAERVAQRGGFSYSELTRHLGRAPATWRPR